MNLLNYLTRGRSSPTQTGNKNVVYTIIIGNYDDLKEPEIVSPDFDYVCLTDRDDLTSPTWKFIKVIAAQNVIRAKKDNPEIVNKQMEKYHREGYPEHNGLLSSQVLIRRRNDKNLRKHCRLWLREINRHSQRDQLSFNYTLWKYRLIDPVWFSHEVREKEFRLYPHKFRQQF